MKLCDECGRVNPPEATYCMTCGTSLTGERARRDHDHDHGWERRAYDEPPSQKRGRVEEVAPLLEDFAFDVMRAGVKLYFGIKDPKGARRRDEPGRSEPDIRDRIERLKDMFAEARVGHRRRGQRPPEDRDWR